MALDKTQPFREIHNAMGNVYFEQAGTYYDVFGNVVSVPPFPSYNSPNPQWQYDTVGNPLALSGPAAGVVRLPRMISQSGVPFILPSSGSMANNGVLSGIVALPMTFSAGAWIYMPANAIQAGSAAGWYWFVASGTTGGTVYNNTYTSSDPQASIPTTPTAFTSTGPGAYTQVVTIIDAAQFSLPGGALGANGLLRNSYSCAMSATASNKVPSFVLGGQTMHSNTFGGGTTTDAEFIGTIRNLGTQQAQSSNLYVSAVGSAAAGSRVYRSLDLTAAQTAKYQMSITTAATDFLILLGYDSVVQARP